MAMTDHSKLLVGTSDSTPSSSNVSKLSIEAAQQRVGRTAQKNLHEMFEGSDNPQELKEALGKVAKDDPKLTFAMLRFGWEKTLSIRRERAVSIGMVGALIFSVTLGMAVAPLEPTERVTAEGFEDFWSDVRPLFEDMYNVLITFGATLSAVSVVNSALYILWIQIYVSDADDFIWFCREYHVTHWVDAPMVLALFFSVLAVAFASVTLYPNPVASVCFFSVIGVLSFTVAVFVMGVVPGERRMQEYFSSISERYNAYIEEAAAEVSIAKTVSSEKLKPGSPDSSALELALALAEKLSCKDENTDQIVSAVTSHVDQIVSNDTSHVDQVVSSVTSHTADTFVI